MARISFVELPVPDLLRADKFFAEVFGWTLTSFGPTYACTMTGDVDLGLQADASKATKAPLVVIQVEDLAASLEAVKSAGGTISKEPFSFPGGRRFHFLDPAGHELAVLEVEKAVVQQ